MLADIEIAVRRALHIRFALLALVSPCDPARPTLTPLQHLDHAFRHDQTFQDGNHRTATLYLHVVLWNAGYDTGALDPLQIYLLISPQQQRPNAVEELVRVVRRHVKRGEMSRERQTVVAEWVKSLPVIASLLYFVSRVCRISLFFLGARVLILLLVHYLLSCSFADISTLRSLGSTWTR